MATERTCPVERAHALDIPYLLVEQAGVLSETGVPGWLLSRMRDAGLISRTHEPADAERWMDERLGLAMRHFLLVAVDGQHVLWSRYPTRTTPEYRERFRQFCRVIGCPARFLRTEDDPPSVHHVAIVNPEGKSCRDCGKATCRISRSGHCEGCDPAKSPSPEEIAERTAEIREEWGHTTRGCSFPGAIRHLMGNPHTRPERVHRISRDRAAASDARYHGGSLAGGR